MARKTKDSGDFEPQIRFNWGYHQAHMDGIGRKVSRVYDRYYYAGYEAGLKEGDIDSSLVAWQEWICNDKAQRKLWGPFYKG